MFSKGDLIIDKKLNRQGIVLKAGAGVIEVKWFDKQIQTFALNKEPEMLTTAYVRSKIISGDFIFQEKTHSQENS